MNHSGRNADRNSTLALVLNGGSGLADYLTKSLESEGIEVVALGEESLSDDAQVSETALSIVEDLGTPSMILNDLVVGPAKAALELSAADIMRDLKRMLVAPFSLVRAFAPAMRDAGGGSVLNITSMEAFHAYPGRFAEAIVRSSVVTMTRALGVEWATLGIRVNAIAVGLFESEDPLNDRIRARVPLGRPARKDEIASAAMLLLDGRAPFVTGQTVRVDGGWAAVDSASPGLRFQ